MDEKLKILIHKNGLTIHISDSINLITETDIGFKLNLGKVASRQINEIEIKLVDSIDMSKNTFEKKKINNESYFYSLNTFNEGSGGVEYSLKIYKPKTSGGVYLEHYIQKNSKPSFEKTWAIIESSSSN